MHGVLNTLYLRVIKTVQNNIYIKFNAVLINFS